MRADRQGSHRPGDRVAPDGGAEPGTRGPAPWVRHIIAAGLAALPGIAAGEAVTNQDRLSTSLLLVPSALAFATGLVSGVLVRGSSGVAVLAAGSITFALPVLTTSSPLVWASWYAAGSASVLIGHGVTRTVARMADGGRWRVVTLGQTITILGAVAWLAAQVLPAWTYTPLSTTHTDPGVSFTFLPLAYIGNEYYVFAWPANLLLLAAWWLEVNRSAYGLTAVNSDGDTVPGAAGCLVLAAGLAVLGVAATIAVSRHEEVIEIGTWVWCGSFLLLAVGAALRAVETRRTVARRPDPLTPTRI